VVVVMKKTSLFCAVAAGLLAIAPVAYAADGTIDFTGQITGLTCTINGGGGNNNFTVTLPPVSTSSLAAVGSVAGRTPFSITLTGCTPDTGTVAVEFLAGPSVDVGTGQLITDPGVGMAGNVQIRLLNSDFTQIMIGAALGTQNSHAVSIDSGSATLNYYIEYAQHGAVGATPGVASSRVQYTLIYQ